MAWFKRTEKGITTPTEEKKRRSKRTLVQITYRKNYRPRRIGT